MATQIGGLTGRRRKDGRADEVEARAGYLPSLYAAKDAQDYNRARQALAEKALTQSTQNARDALELQENTAAKEKKLAVAGMGSQFGMGLGNYIDDPTPQTTKIGGEGAKEMILDGTVSDASFSDFFDDPSGVGGNSEGWIDALGSKNSYLGLLQSPLGGQLASSLTGRDDFVTNALGGAAASALTDAFVNPSSDFYSGVMNAIGGGVAGGGFSLF